MINLDSTAKSLEILLGAAPSTQLPFVVAYADHNASVPSFTPVEGDGVTNSTTAVTMVGAPGAGVQRQIKFISVYNANSAASTVTLRVNNGGTFRIIAVIPLQVGERLEYEDANGFSTFDSTGARKSTGSSGSTDRNNVNTLSIASGVVNVNCALGDFFTLSLTANVTSITFTNLPAAGKAFALAFRIQQDATGSRTVALPSSFKAITGSDTAVQSAPNAYSILHIETFDQGARWEYSMKAGAP